jgi:hypothetical protein
MADLSQYYDALKNADAAGDHKAAQQIADYIHGQETAGASAQPHQQQQPAAPKTTSERVKDSLANLQSENPLNKLGPSGEPSPSPTLAGAAKAVAGSTAFGGVAGALSPEIIQGLGVAATFIPGIGEAVGPALIETGQALKPLRQGMAAAGAFSGAISETAGQVAEASGASKGTAAAARLAGGLLSPGAGALAGFVPKAGKLAWTMAQKMAGAEVSVPKAVETARENMARMAEAGQPQTAMHAMLQKGVEENRQATEKAADAMMAQVHADAARVAQSNPATASRMVAEGEARAAQMRADAAKQATALEKASDGKIKTAAKVLAQAAPELAKVGQVSELSDIGTTIRQAATVKQGAELQARNEAYKATVAERDAAVAAKEKAGQSIDETPSIRALKKDLATRLGKVRGFEQTTDQGVRRGYQQIQDAITRRDADTGLLDAAGKPIIEKGKTSFEALDQVRRKLGDVISGHAPVEGYDAIGKQAAQRMYAQISKAQEEFAGEAQKTLQRDYAEGSANLTKFGSKAGKKLTALDRVDPERFAGDPKALPKAFFSSQQGVRDLRELTGNPELVNRQASDYAARSMQGMSSKQAKEYVRENRDWLREIPGLTERSTAYANKLEQIERINKGLQDRAESLAKTAAKVREKGIEEGEAYKQGTTARVNNAMEASAKEQARILKEGTARVEAAKAEAQAPAKGLETILKGGESPEAIRNLLLNGKPEQTRLAAQHLASQPGGKEVLEASVRQTMRNMTEGNLRQQWQERIRPMLRDGKMLPEDRLRVLEADVNRLLSSYKGKDKMTLIQRHIAAALGTAAGPQY